MIFVIFNEIIILNVIWTTAIITSGPLDLIVNFSGAMFVCELDNLVMKTGRVQNLKERFDDLDNQDDDRKSIKRRDTVRQDSTFHFPTIN